VDPKTLIKKSDIIILHMESLDPEMKHFLRQEQSVVSGNTSASFNSFLVFIRRIANEFEFKSIFHSFRKKFPNKILDLSLKYLMPQFSLSKDCIGGSGDFITSRGIRHFPTV
jgi:hypothetical protein